MMISLQKINDSIPLHSTSVKNLFNRSVTPNAIPYRIVARYVYASFAIGISAVNTIGYGIVIVSHLSTAFIYRDFKDITKNCRQDASHVFQSFYFCVAMSTYLFMSIIQRPGYALHLDPYLQTPEFRAPVLESTIDLEGFNTSQYEIPGLGFILYADIASLRIESLPDTASLAVGGRPSAVSLIPSRLERSAHTRPIEGRQFAVHRQRFVRPLQFAQATSKSHQRRGAQTAIS